MPSALSFFVIYSVIVFVSGAVFGALVLFVISIHRSRRTSLFEGNEDGRGTTARSVLISARGGFKDGDQ
jgi:hypothetical protein